ncbi:Tad domain-containing protein [Phenylobacterium sp.]|uniref:Tad domain-containing protein n=1 Tax=Phenylobacterium sp. TaxID=1871053 RepID=UPI002E2F4F54|nr:Tad domain-containing protein [Phenylobacterium sp.]HEX2561501.1 Tad domain-containing protein [Phenylobacterium sp.]
MGIAKSLLRLLRDERGGLALWAGLTAPVLVGFGALSVDVARMYNLDADLQTAADSLARAGAIELDRRSDSITRSTAAINNLVINEQQLGDAGGGQVQIASLRFLKALPISDDTPITAGYVTTDPKEARYVEVNVAPTAITTVFPPNLVRGLVRSQLTAQAVGGRKSGMCGAAPLFICNPYEGSGQSLQVALEDRAVRGRLVQLRGKGGGSAYGPGNFGFLEPPGGRGANELRDMMGQVSPDTCYDAEGVILRSGQISSVSQGLNTRFDMYDGSFGGKKDDPAYAPARNVTKGYTYTGNNACNASPEADTSKALGLPRDACFSSGNCPNMGGRMGDGNWDVVSYMRVNHRRPATATISGITYTFNYAAGTVSPLPRPTRYEVYRWEIDNNRIPGEYNPTGSGPNTQEKGGPRCFSGTIPAGPDRRIIPVAVLNCQALEAQYGLNGNSNPPLPAIGFAKVFLTEPMGSGSDDIIWGELVGMLQKGVDPWSTDQVEVRR